MNLSLCLVKVEWYQWLDKKGLGADLNVFTPRLNGLIVAYKEV
jgi:hypothetical protein